MRGGKGEISSNLNPLAIMRQARQTVAVKCFRLQVRWLAVEDASVASTEPQGSDDWASVTKPREGGCRFTGGSLVACGSLIRPQPHVKLTLRVTRKH